MRERVYPFWPHGHNRASWKGSCDYEFIFTLGLEQPSQLIYESYFSSVCLYFSILIETIYADAQERTHGGNVFLKSQKNLFISI